MSKNTIVLISLYSKQYIGIRSIYYQLLNKGFDVYLVYFKEYGGIETKPPSEKEYTLLINLLKELNPSIVGISMLTFAFEMALDITKKIRENMNPLIVFGGIHAIIKPEECIKHADVVCEWEGEEALAELCDKFFQGKDYSNIPNLWVRKGNKIIKNPVKPIMDLDEIALPDFKSKNFFYIDNGKLTKGEWKLMDGHQYFIMTSKGCPNRCTYCTNSTLAKKLDSTPYKGKYVRKRSVENVIKELKSAKKHFKLIKRIRIFDDIFTLDVNWLEKFSEAYRKEIGIPFWCNLHAAFVNDKTIPLLKRAGLVDCSMGVESGSQKFRRDVYKKYVSDKKICDAVKILKENKIDFLINIITNNPLETDEDLREGVKFLLSLRPIDIGFLSLTNYPSTELTNDLLESGLIEKSDASFTDSFGFRVSKKQQFKNMRNNYWFYIFNFIPKPYIPKFLISFLTKDIFVKNPKFLLRIFNIGNKLYQLKEIV